MGVCQEIMKYVLITGGSSGIGYEFAKIFAEKGYGICLAASKEEKLLQAKDKLQNQYRCEVYCYAIDLSKLGAADELYCKVKADGINIDILINNAGCGVIGATEEIPIAKEEQMMLLNMVTPVELTKKFLMDMYEKGRGRIWNVASTGAFQPGPYTATYYASKAFLLNYSRAVRFEAKKKGVSVCTLCPGTTDTGFFERAGSKVPKGAMSPEKVARYAYKKMIKNKSVTVPGLSYRLMRLCPVPIKITAVAWVKGKKNS